MFKTNTNIKEFIKASLIRAIWTMAQAALSMITIGMKLTDIDWIHVVSISIVAGLYSLLKSVVLGVPEAYRDGTLQIDGNTYDKEVYRMVFNSDLEELKNKNTVTFTVDDSAVIDEEENEE